MRYLPRMTPPLDEAWQTALSFWGVQPQLLPPRALEGPGPHPAIAWIDLVARQVYVDVQRITAFGAGFALPALLAHELGHHVRWPHTLGEDAALRLLQRRILPHHPGDLTNLFFDLLINQAIGLVWPASIAALYRGCIEGGRPSPEMVLVLGVYEVLLGEVILSDDTVAAMEGVVPGWRGDAQRIAETLWELTSIHDQFVYFCCELAPFLDAGGREQLQLAQGPGNAGDVTMLGRDLPDPSPEDLADALLGNPLSDAAIERAIEQGLLRRAEAGAMPTAQEAVAAILPGSHPGTTVHRVSSRLYHSLVDRYLFELPGTEDGPEPDPWLPSTTSDWEPGDEPADIDWVASTLRGGAFASATLQRRDRIAEPEDPDDGPATAVEIWLDTSGSMPSPLHGYNAMTLAAQVLAAASIRKGGRVRAFVWSAGPVLQSGWLYDEDAARDFLLQHIGSGTEFPFDLFLSRVRAEPQVMRVIISDSDLVWCCGRERRAADILNEAATRSRRLVFLLHSGSADPILARITDRERVVWVTVNDVHDLAGEAGKLASALWD